MMTIPAPGPKKNIHVKISRFSYGYIFITAFFVRKRFVEHFFPQTRETPNLSTVLGMGDIANEAADAFSTQIVCNDEDR